MGDIGVVPGGDAVIKAFINAEGYVVRVNHLNNSKPLKDEEYAIYEGKKIVGASLARQFPVACRWVTVSARDKLNGKRDSVNFGVKPKPMKKKTAIIVAFVNALGYVVRANRISDDKPLDDRDYHKDEKERILGARLASRSTPCCWAQDPAGNWRCYPCL